jgi:hypothetical protein
MDVNCPCSLIFTYRNGFSVYGFINIKKCRLNATFLDAYLSDGICRLLTIRRNTAIWWDFVNSVPLRQKH